jgi:RhoGAP domain
VFGSDPNMLEKTPYRKHAVPSILVCMRECLERNDAFHEEGIFRLAGDAEEILRLKNLMNRKKFDASDDINTIANLIKIWFRDLPVPLLNHIEVDSILDDDPDACIAAYKTQLPGRCCPCELICELGL